MNPPDTVAQDPTPAEPSHETKPRRRYFIQVEWWVPTLRGWLVLLVGALILAGVIVEYAHPFLSPNAPLSDGVLVVEGWGDDEMMWQAVKTMDAGRYQTLYVTGMGIDRTSVFSEYGSQPELSAAIIRQISEGRVEPIPVVADNVRKDRTYSSGLRLKEYMQSHGGIPKKITLLSSGPHSRRSQLMFRKAFGDSAEIGIIAHQPAGYDPAHWWRDPEGIRTVVSEGVAYLYARWLFWNFG